jgi:hypothetical protein
MVDARLDARILCVAGRCALPYTRSVPQRWEEGEQRPSSPFDASVIRASARRYDGILDMTLRSAVVPYGYTVTIWAAGAYLIRQRGLPSVFEAFAFVAGAILAFAVLTAISQRRHQPVAESGQQSAVPPFHLDSRHPIFAAGLHIAAVGLALGSAALIDSGLGQAAWLLAPFAVTSIYLAIASAELAIAIELRQREIGLRTARVIVRHPHKAIRRVVRR